MPSTRDSFESIKVINHTECDCVYKNQAVQRTTRVPPFPHWPLPTSTKPPMCKCPSFFTSEVDEDDVCACVCKTKIECIQRHEGNEGFTLSDRRSDYNFLSIFVMKLKFHSTQVHPNWRVCTAIVSTWNLPRPTRPLP